MNFRRLASSLFVLSGLWSSTAALASGRVVLYPGVARLAGANGTAWRSDAVFHNPGSAPLTLQLELLPRGSASVAASAPLALAVGETRQIDDVMDFLHAGNGAGMLRVTGDVIAWVRTFNLGSEGTFGQALPGIEPDGAYGPGEQIVFPFSTAPDIKTAFRSNLLLVNLDTVTITVTFHSGAISKTTTVPAGAYVQVDNLGAFLGTPEGFAALWASADGRWAGAISTVDPVTGDPTTVRGLGPGETDERLFAGIAKAAGNNGTAWRSEATLHNPSDEPVSTTLSLIPRGGSAVAVSTVLNLAAGETRRLADVYQTLGVASGAGALRVSGGVLAWVRTFNQGAQGTFGQDLPPIDAEVAVGASVPVALPFRSAASIQTDFRSNLVVENLDDHDITLSIRAGAVTKTQVVPAGAYAQIDNLGAFLGLPPGAATAWVQADGQWAGTVSTIDPYTGDPTTLRDDRTFRPPTSYDLINAALAAQTINAEQALTYKVYVDFADPRLPANLHGDDRNVQEGTALNDAEAAFDGLSAATQELIGPFLVPPFYQGSWWDLRRAGSSGLQAQTSPCRPWVVTCSILDDWGYYDKPHVRVWFLKSHPTDESVAHEIGDFAENEVWPKFMPSMGRLPKPDGGMGGADSLDIVMSDGLGSDLYGSAPRAGYLGNYSACRDTAAFCYVSRDIHNVQQRKSTVAHEMFHAVQYAFPGPECLTSGSMNWLTESTATWFSDYVCNDCNKEHDKAPSYLDQTDVPLDVSNGDADRAYGAYVFFFYLTRIRGVAPSIMGEIWKATASADSLHAVKSALHAAGADLDSSWPDFAVYAWNRQKPFQKFFDVDKLLTEAKPMPQRPGSLGGPSATWEIIPKSEPPIPHLSIRYFRYDFPDATTSSVGFFNGLSRSLDKITVEDYGDVYSSTELPLYNQGSGGHVTALIKIDDGWTKEDWTNVPARTFCRDMASERLQSLVIILSNASIDSMSDVWVHGRYPPLLFASNVGCGPWEGDASLQYKWGPGVTETMSVTGLELTPIADGLYDENTPLFRAYVPSAGGFAWSAAGSAQGCSYSGGYGAATSNPLSQFHVLPWVVSGVGYRGMIADLFWEWLIPQFVLTEVCPDGSAPGLWNAAEFYLGVIPEYTWARVSPDGKSITINAASIPDHDGLSGTWHFRAKREP